jgi:bifunctional N-acetylglucosamine-1-phosphate-uridyltransferase/glucosamine-1-phosphate-acetyltransferase GlmU-like protein
MSIEKNKSQNASHSNSAIIIMAGGLGKRMNSELPKVLHYINDVPMIVKIIRETLLLSPMRIFVVVGKYRDIIEYTINQFIPNERRIEYVLQNVALGTAHAIKCCLPRLLFYQNFYINYNVLILSGDVPLISANSMRIMLSELNDARIMTTTLENPHGYGRIIKSTDGVFQKIVEEKHCTEEERLCKNVNTGIYAFKAYMLCEYIPLITQDTTSQCEFYLTDIVQIIKEYENVNIETIEIPSEKQYEVIGVNTSEQLEYLSSILPQL